MFDPEEAEAAGNSTDATSKRVWATDEVLLTDCIGSPVGDPARPDLTFSNMATADVLIIFLGEDWGSDGMKDTLLWAWRLRQTTRTIFVMPKLDVRLAGHTK